MKFRRLVNIVLLFFARKSRIELRSKNLHQREVKENFVLVCNEFRF